MYYKQSGRALYTKYKSTRRGKQTACAWANEKKKKKVEKGKKGNMKSESKKRKIKYIII